MPNTSDIWKIDGEYDEQGEETGDAAKARDKFAGPYCGDLSGCGTFMTPPAFGCVLYEPGNAVRMVAK